MPKAVRKYYAVAVGREGPKIYDNWDECKAQTARYPAVFKSFTSLQHAEQWIASQVAVRGAVLPAAETLAPLFSGVHDAPQSNTTQDDSVLPDTVSPFPYETPPASTSVSQMIVDDDHRPLSPRPSVMLSPEQQQVLNRVKNGQNVFFTGSAGTGKSVLLREIINTLKDRDDTVGITASTGIAAVNIGGSTLHSWAGVGLADQPADRYVGKFRFSKQWEKVHRRWLDVTALIIDEVSMIDGSLFDKLVCFSKAIRRKWSSDFTHKETIARALRRNEHPFGGIQLVLSGDFCQLPPVPSRDNRGQQIPPVFAFDAQTWDACVERPVMLTHVFRQKEQGFVDMLNAMRFGELDANAIVAFSALDRKVEYADGIEPTELFSTRIEVKNANSSRLVQLKTEPHQYIANDISGTDSNGNRVGLQKMEHLLERLVVPKQIHLKVGAQVMLVKNLIQGQLVNGSVGQVVRFVTTQDAVSEGAHIAGADRGEGRQRLPPSDFIWPVVRFIGGREIVVIPQEFTVNNADGTMEARRIQVPLILSWALSIHKSQGQTLERVKVDLRHTFEKGQAYVALSRATRMDQLQVLNFDASKVTAHPRVVAWYHAWNPPKHCDNEVIELFDDDDDIPRTAPPVASATATDVIDLTESLDDEVDGEVVKTLHHDL